MTERFPQLPVLLGERYELRSIIGKGGMAQVWEAWDRRLERHVAAKLLNPSLAQDVDARNRFEHEARAAARLAHPNVVAVFDSGETSGTAWIVMERLSGVTLADRIKQEGQLPLSDTLRMAEEVLGALGAAHASGIIHRDVKPANILLGSDGSAKVGDFGIAKAADATGDAAHTAVNILLGTPAYLAPERAEGAPATASSDIWSLGVVLYEALSGRRPFAGSNALATALAARTVPEVPLGDLRPGLSPVLLAVIEKAMNSNPALRYSSTAEMAQALDFGSPGGLSPQGATGAGQSLNGGKSGPRNSGDAVAAVAGAAFANRVGVADMSATQGTRPFVPQSSDNTAASSTLISVQTQTTPLNKGPLHAAPRNNLFAHGMPWRTRVRAIPGGPALMAGAAMVAAKSKELFREHRVGYLAAVALLALIAGGALMEATSPSGSRGSAPAGSVTTTVPTVAIPPTTTSTTTPTTTPPPSTTSPTTVPPTTAPPAVVAPGGGKGAHHKGK